ncbi:MAG: SWIM zinc finger family protein, partial [Bdellovibrionota bacterium]
MRHSRRNKNTGPLSGRIGDRFAHQIRDRGMRYYQEGMVGSPTFGPELVTVSVRGSERYSVRVDWSRVDRNNEILIDCSCPHYEGGSFCKHCWAVVLYLEDEGIADEIPGNNRLKVTHLMAHAPREKKQNSGRRDRDRNRRRDRSLRELEPSEHDKPVERDADGRPIQPMNGRQGERPGDRPGEPGRGAPMLPRGPGVAPAQPSGPALP